MVNIPQLTGLFEPTPYVPPKDATENNIATIAALQDPSGTLGRMQADQIAKLSSQVKMEGIDTKYKSLALDAINDFQNKSMALYKGNKGFNRLQLDGKQLLEENANYKELIGNVTALKQLTADNQQTLETVEKAFIGQAMSPEDYALFSKRIAEAEAKVKTIGDVPNYRAIYNNFLHERPQRWNSTKSTGMYKTPEAWADNINKPQSGEYDKDYKVDLAKNQILTQFGSGEWQQSTRPMLYQTGVLREGMSPAQELEAAVSYAQGRFNPAENRRGNTTNKIYMPTSVKNWTAPYTIPPQSKKVIFKQDKIKGFVATEQIKDVNGNIVAEVGDVIKPTTLEGGAVTINIIKNGKYQDLDLGDGNRVFMPSPGSVAEPIPGKIVYDGQIKEQIQNMAGKPDGTGNVDPSGYENIGSGVVKQRKPLPPDTQKNIDKVFGKAKASPNTMIITPDGEMKMGDVISTYELTPAQIKKGLDNGTLKLK